MGEVFFLKDLKKLATTTKELLKEFYPTDCEVLVKIHFGEPGNKLAFTPNDVKPIVEAMKSLKLQPVFIDTPTAYPSPRDTVKGYEKAVREKGFDKLAPFIISNKGKKVKTKDFVAGVCQELAEAENVLVISHVKGHSCSGFGGAVKNLGMGGVTKETKNTEHNLCKPKFVSECQGCGICVDFCPAEAIKMVDTKAKLNNDVCYGCSICQIECPYGCLAPQKAYFDDLLAQGAAAVISKLSRKTFYINFIKNVTKMCDCEVDPGDLVSKDVGILFGDNPCTIDKASVDLINKRNQRNIFKEINHKDPFLHVRFASEYIERELDYKLVSI